MENNKSLEQILNGLLGKIAEEKQEKISANEEMFFWNLEGMYQNNYEEAVRYTQKYKKIITNDNNQK